MTNFLSSLCSLFIAKFHSITSTKVYTLEVKLGRGSVLGGTEPRKGKRRKNGKGEPLSYCEPSPRKRPGGHRLMEFGSHFTSHSNPSPPWSDPNVHTKSLLQGSPYSEL